MRRLHVVLLVGALLATSAAIFHAKVARLGLPLLPHTVEPVWAIEARVRFEGRSRAAVATLGIPDRLGGYLRLEEYFASRSYGLNVEGKGEDRRIEWSTRRARGPQQLYYRIEVIPEVGTKASAPPGRAPPPPARPAYSDPIAAAVDDVLGEVRAESANVFTFVSQLLVKLNDPSPEASVQVLRDGAERGSQAWVERLIYILAGARIPARMVRGLVLEDGVSNQQMLPWLEVHNGQAWQGFDPLSGEKGYPENYLRWTTGSAPLLTVENGRDADVSFAISRYSRSLTQIARDRATETNAWLGELLLFELPIATQNVYRILLMVPLGAFVVAFMRTVVGTPTLGTFMPILIAIAFRETELAWGITLFVVITAAGLSLRFYLERLQLLLVPRLCAVLVLIVLLMLAISLVSAKLGLDRGFSIALFPIVILTMVVEHMSVVWEESGPGTALREGLGALAIAVVGYLVMANETLNHIMFLFPELLLALLAAFIVLGRYTGYRLTELVRFRDIVDRGR
ncbi:MAG: UUP1 family membrane protein [Gammaproteobacteria bacterium]